MASYQIAPLMWRASWIFITKAEMEWKAEWADLKHHTKTASHRRHTGKRGTHYQVHSVRFSCKAVLNFHINCQKSHPIARANIYS